MVALLYLLIPFLGLGRAVSAPRLGLANFVAGAAWGGGHPGCRQHSPTAPLSLFFFFFVSSFALVCLDGSVGAGVRGTVLTRLLSI